MLAEGFAELADTAKDQAFNHETPRNTPIIQCLSAS